MMRIEFMGMGKLDGSTHVELEPGSAGHREIERAAAERLDLPADRVACFPIGGTVTLIQGRIMLRVDEGVGPILGRYMGFR